MSGDNNVIQSFQIQQSSSHTVRRTGSLTWKIRDFTTQCQLRSTGECLESQKFRIHGDEREWWVKLYPKGNRADSQEFISVFLSTNKGENIFIRCEFSLIDVSHEKTHTKQFSQLFGSDYWGYAKFTHRAELFLSGSLLLPEDELTISCILTATSGTTYTRIAKMQEDRLPDISIGNTLNDDLSKLFRENNTTDVVLKVGSDQIRSHKILLMSRSPVFASMFGTDMLEKDTNQVVITDVEFEVLSELVRFMYTDEAPTRDVSFMAKLLVAADKYDVKLLKTRCAELLCDSVSLSNVFEVLSMAEACNEDELIQKCMHIIETEMISVASLSSWISKANSRPEVLAIIQRLLDAKHQANEGSE